MELRQIRPTMLRLLIDGECTIYLMRLSAQGDQSAAVRPYDHSPLKLVARHLNYQLNMKKPGSLRRMLQTIVDVYPTLKAIRSFRTSLKQTCGSNDLFTLVCRGVTWVRLYYRDRYAIDIRCIGHGMVHVTDGYNATAFPHGPHDQQQHTEGNTSGGLVLKPLSKLRDLWAAHERTHGSFPASSAVLMDRSASSSAHATTSTGGTGDLSASAYGLVMEEAMERCLHAIHKCMGTMYLMDQTSAVLRQLGFEPTPSASTGAVTFKVPHIHNVVLRVAHEDGGEQLTLACAPHPPMGDAQGVVGKMIGNLAVFFRARVCAPPYTRASLSSFFRLLKLPLPVLEVMANSLALDKACEEHHSLPATTNTLHFVLTKKQGHRTVSAIDVDLDGCAISFSVVYGTRSAAAAAAAPRASGRERMVQLDFAFEFSDGNHRLRVVGDRVDMEAFHKATEDPWQSQKHGVLKAALSILQVQPLELMKGIILGDSRKRVDE